jgi:hypothetical protein
MSSSEAVSSNPRKTDIKTIVVGGSRPIQVPTGIRMAYMDHLGRENVVFVPNLIRVSPMGDWDELDVPVLLLSTQSQSLFSGAPIEWREEKDQIVRIVPASEVQERLRPLILTVADLIEWARISRDPFLPNQLLGISLNILTWLGRPHMTPTQHSHWMHKLGAAITEIETAS